MAGTGHAAAIERLRVLASVSARVGQLTEHLQLERDEAIRDALDEGVTSSRIAKALGISRQGGDQLIKRASRRANG